MAVLTILCGVCLSLLMKIAHDTLSCYFLNPRRIKKIMERQGVRGPKPRPLKGNILDMASLVSKTTSQDMNSINHDIVGRLLPHYVAWSKQYGRQLAIISHFHITLISLEIAQNLLIHVYI
jgi:cytokinin trans-hydroxylase